MIKKYVIYLAHNQFCNCFSDSDLAVNVRFALSQGLVIVSVDAVAA